MSSTVKKCPKRRVATEYHWPTVYKIIKASSDQAVCRALARFAVELGEWRDLHHR